MGICVHSASPETYERRHALHDQHSVLSVIPIYSFMKHFPALLSTDLNITNDTSQLREEYLFYEKVYNDTVLHTLSSGAIAGFLTLHFSPILLPIAGVYFGTNCLVQAWTFHYRNHYKFMLEYNAMDAYRYTDTWWEKNKFLIVRMPGIFLVIALFGISCWYSWQRTTLRVILYGCMNFVVIYIYSFINLVHDADIRAHQAVINQYIVIQNTCNIYKLGFAEYMKFRLSSFVWNYKVNWETGYIVNNAECDALYLTPFSDRETLLELLFKTMQKPFLMLIREFVYELSSYPLMTKLTTLLILLVACVNMPIVFSVARLICACCWSIVTYLKTRFVQSSAACTGEETPSLNSEEAIQDTQADATKHT
jgi:hypothetical protein